MAGAIANTIRAELGFREPPRKQVLGTWPGTVIYNVTSKDAMIQLLNGASPTTYTITRLLNMTDNDMVYAIRTIYDPTGL